MRSASRKSVLFVTILALAALGSWKLLLAAPAPPLTAVVVEAVSSTNHPAWEVIRSGALSTVKDHGGRTLWVQTREYGYGQNQIARFNSFNMRLVQSTPVTDAARNITGWRRVWSYSGSFTSGRFTFQANSLAGIPSTRSTALSIR